MLRCRLLLVVALVISLGALLSSGQHWSHGWYPGGKRELNSPPSEISAELTLCESGECSYLRPQRRNVLRNIFLDAVARELQRK